MSDEMFMSPEDLVNKIPTRELKPHQRGIGVAKISSDTDHPFYRMNFAAASKVRHDFPGMGGAGPYFLWEYINSNQNGYYFGLSSKDFCDTWCVSKDTYTRAFNSLVAKGYLRHIINTHGGAFEYYLFCEDGTDGVALKQNGWDENDFNCFSEQIGTHKVIYVSCNSLDGNADSDNGNAETVKGNADSVKGIGDSDNGRSLDGVSVDGVSGIALEDRAYKKYNIYTTDNKEKKEINKEKREMSEANKRSKTMSAANSRRSQTVSETNEVSRHSQASSVFDLKTFHGKPVRENNKSLFAQGDTRPPHFFEFDDCVYMYSYDKSNIYAADGGVGYEWVINDAAELNYESAVYAKEHGDEGRMTDAMLAAAEQARAGITDSVKMKFGGREFDFNIGLLVWFYDDMRTNPTSVASNRLAIRKAIAVVGAHSKEFEYTLGYVNKWKELL